jgi:multiple sugar transport system ATP-binding protein
MASVSFRGLTKSFGPIQIVKAIDLEIADREFVVLVGPSGCGKSTTLRMVAGLESISGGEIRIGDVVVNSLQPRERDIAMVFQDYALYPHKTVRENMAFSLRVRRMPADQIARRIDEAAAMLGIGALLDRRPGQLSGGQRQRVAMGRAIVRRPKLFLFDEPLSNLDAKLRGQVRTEIKKLHQAVGATMLYVTHDQVEAMTLADRIVIMRGGVIEQVGTPDDVYNEPNSVFVGGFIGSPAMNFLKARADGAKLTFANGDHLTCAARLGPTDVVVGVRPEHLLPDAGSEQGLSGIVQVVEPLGADTLVHLEIMGEAFTARVDPFLHPKPGETMRFRVEPARLRLFDPITEKSIT